MQRATVAQPIVASEDWYAPPAVIDGSLAESSMEWTELLAAHLAAAQGGPPVERSRLTQALSRGDVPQKLRAEVWLTFSGANERIEKHPAVYEQLCERVASHHEKRAVGAPATAAAGSSEAGEAGSSSAHAAAGGADAANRVLEQVEKDLRRTDIGTEGVRLDAMRRVLCAYAAFNPEVGYVQGMNFIVVALLALLDERQSFWMLVLVVQDWLPDHFTRAMVGNHIDCRVLSRLTAENLPQLTERLRQLDVTVQLLTTRWFLCLWSSVLPGPTLMRLWDFLFVLGPSSTMQAALACMHMIEPSVLVTRDIGEALSGVKRVLRTADAETLLDIARVRVGEISREQLFAWRLHCRQVVLHETRHVQATRRLLKLQRSSGFALQELKLMARLCGPYTLAPADAASSLLQLTLDFEGFARALRGLVPQWKNECLLFERLFEFFLALPSDGRHDIDLELDRRETAGMAAGSYGEADAASANGHGVDGNGAGSDGGTGSARPRLTFEQLVQGLGWLLRGTSAKRSELCFRCFEDSGTGRVRRERFSALLTSVYVLYEASWPVAQPDLERIEAEAEQFVAMMHHLYDEAGSGSLDREAFDRAAHQHPLLVQAFQLEQLDMPIPPPAQPEAPSPLGNDRLRAKNGVYSGLRPGAVSRFDETYFDGAA